MYPDSKFRGANMGPIWGRKDPGGPHVGPMNFVFWVAIAKCPGSFINIIEYFAIVQNETYQYHT